MAILKDIKIVKVVGRATERNFLVIVADMEGEGGYSGETMFCISLQPAVDFYGNRAIPCYIPSHYVMPFESTPEAVAIYEEYKRTGTIPSIVHI